jgi:predicted CopG family antitoxin
MRHRSITISDEAYLELSKMKKEWESFTDVVLRLASGRGSARALTVQLKALFSTDDLAESIETATKRTRRASFARITAS